MTVERTITLAFSLAILLAFAPAPAMAQEKKDPPKKVLPKPPGKKLPPPCVLKNLPIPEFALVKICGLSKKPPIKEPPGKEPPIKKPIEK